MTYYTSEFNIPAGQEAAVDKAMSTMDKLVDKEQRSISRAGNSLVLDEVVSSGRITNTLHFFGHIFSCNVIFITFSSF